MAQPYVTPVEVDKVRVTAIVDNHIDVLLGSTEVAERYLTQMATGHGRSRESLRASAGYR